MRKVCLFTSTRAEWGLLRGLATRLRSDDRCSLDLLVSGTHLSAKFGMTVAEIEKEEFKVSERVDILHFDDSPRGICKTMGRALSEYGEALARLMPDVLVVLGDRYETLCIAAAAQVLRIPIAHIHGGETTEGAIDEAFRHSITKMAHLHFPACENYRNRIIQLGENPSNVFNVGSLGIENIRNLSFLTRNELEQSIDFSLGSQFFLVTFHPVTLEAATSGEQFDALLRALEDFPDYKIIFTHANADTDGAIINEKIEKYTASNPLRCYSVSSLGLHRYLSAMRFCSAVVGNSSSGILEAPAFKVPTINIGDRQKGRIRAQSIIDCDPNSESISQAIQQALSPEFKRQLENSKNPFEQENTADKIVSILLNANLSGSLKKTFCNLT